MSTTPTTGTFVRAWAWLMMLALASLLLSLLHLGGWSPVVALGIALVKAIIIAALFMHLAEQPSISRWAFALGIALALLLLVMIGIDVVTRETPTRPPRSSALWQPGAARHVNEVRLWELS